MKKNLKTFLSLGLLLGVLSGCGENPQTHTHEWKSGWEKDQSYHWHACNGCDEIDEDSKEAHEFGEWSVTKEASCTEKGEKERTCICGAKQTQEIPMTEHPHSDALSHDKTGHWYTPTCDCKDVKPGFVAHSFGVWEETKAPTADADGEEKRVCVCGEEEIRAIMHKDFKVNYGFKNEYTFTFTDSHYGLDWNIATADNLYQGAYLSMSSCKKSLASAYTFTIKNTGADTLEIRFCYRNGTSKVVANSANAEDYTIVSHGNHSTTKLSKVESGYARFKIKAGDIADITIPLVSQDYDQAIIMPVNTATGASLRIIKTGFVEGTHNWHETYEHDDNYHWKKCDDEACSFINEKANHNWVSDTSKTDVDPTTEAPGVQYKICSVCSATKEVAIPQIGGETERDIDLLGLGFASSSKYIATKNGDAYDVTYTQPAKGYERFSVTAINDEEITKATYVDVTATNTGSADISFTIICRSKIDGTTTCYTTASGTSMLSSQNGNSRYDRVGSTCAYFVLAVGDTAEFRIGLTGPAHVQEVAIQCDPNPTEEKTGSFTVSKFTLHDDFSNAEESNDPVDLYGTWGSLSCASVSKNADGTSAVTYTQTESTKTTPLQCTDFESLIGSYVSKPIKTITLEITNTNNIEFHSCLAVKDGDGIITVDNGTTCTGDVSFGRHSSGSGEYFNVAANGSGTIKVTLADGKVPSKFRILVAYDKVGEAGSFTIGKITLGF